MSFSVLLLCSDGPHHGCIANKLHQEQFLAGVFCEPESAQMSKLLRRRRYRDYLWRAYHGWRRKLLSLDKFRTSYFGGTFDELVMTLDGVVKVADINSLEIEQYVADHSLDAIVVMGTSIIKSALLESGIPIINIHGGYLPDYKGNHCIFFAYYNNQLDKVGSTIHLIDPGVDSGEVVERVTVPVAETDIPETSYCKAEKRAIDRLVQLLVSASQGAKLPTEPQADHGSVFRTRDRKPIHDLKLWWRIGRLTPYAESRTAL